MTSRNVDKAALDAELERVRGLSSTGRDSEAVALCSDLIETFPGHFEPYFQRGLATHSLGDRSGAIADLTEAIALESDEPASWFFRGRWQIEAGDYAQGISDLCRAIVADEMLGSAYYTDSARLSVAVAYFLAKDFERSKQACEGLPSTATTYLVGRRWTLAGLRHSAKSHRRGTDGNTGKQR